MRTDLSLVAAEVVIAKQLSAPNDPSMPLARLFTGRLAALCVWPRSSAGEHSGGLPEDRDAPRHKRTTDEGDGRPPDRADRHLFAE